MAYSREDAITAERLKDMRDIDERCDDLAHLSNADLSIMVARIAYTFADQHPNMVTLRLAAASLDGEKPIKREFQ